MINLLSITGRNPTSGKIHLFPSLNAECFNFLAELIITSQSHDLNSETLLPSFSNCSIKSSDHRFAFSFVAMASRPPLWQIAFWNKFSSPAAIWRLQLQEPADSPKMVIFLGSPPKEEMLVFTHLIAFLWSRRPSFPDDLIWPSVTSSSLRNPRGPNL